MYGGFNLPRSAADSSSGSRCNPLAVRTNRKPRNSTCERIRCWEIGLNLVRDGGIIQAHDPNISDPVHHIVSHRLLFLVTDDHRMATGYECECMKENASPPF